MIEINKTILMGIYALVGAYLIYRVLFRKNPYEEKYEKLYNRILTSNKYKVKGQYDREE